MTLLGVKKISQYFCHRYRNKATVPVNVISVCLVWFMHSGSGCTNWTKVAPLALRVDWSEIVGPLVCGPKRRKKLGQSASHREGKATAMYFIDWQSHPQSTIRDRGEKWGECTVSVLSAGAYTTTLLVMVDRVKGGGRVPPPPLTRLG
jgi:hypothetical protein